MKKVNTMIEWLQLLIPPDSADNPKAVRRWRRTVMIALVLLILFVVWAVSPYGFARAGDAAEQIAATMKPLTERVEAQNVQLQRLEDGQTTIANDTNDLIIELVATKIRTAILARCRISGDRERENREIEQLQRQYQKRAGERYQQPACHEL